MRRWVGDGARRDRSSAGHSSFQKLSAVMSDWAVVSVRPPFSLWMVRLLMPVMVPPPGTLHTPTHSMITLPLYYLHEM